MSLKVGYWEAGPCRAAGWQSLPLAWVPVSPERDSKVQYRLQVSDGRGCPAACQEVSEGCQCLNLPSKSRAPAPRKLICKLCGAGEWDLALNPGSASY